MLQLAGGQNFTHSNKSVLGYMSSISLCGLIYTQKICRHHSKPLLLVFLSSLSVDVLWFITNWHSLSRSHRVTPVPTNSGLCIHTQAVGGYRLRALIVQRTSMGSWRELENCYSTQLFAVHTDQKTSKLGHMKERGRKKATSELGHWAAASAARIACKYVKHGTLHDPTQS